MSFEFGPRRASEIDLRDYTNYESIYKESLLFDCRIDYVEELRRRQKFDNHMTDVVYPAAVFVEPLFDGKILDPDKRGTKAFIDGGVIAAAIVNFAGGEDILDSLELTLSSPISYDDKDQESWKRRREEIWHLGLTAFYSHEPTFVVYRAFIEEWEKELVAPEDVRFLHAGYGLVMHLANQAIEARAFKEEIHDVPKE